MIVWIQEWYQQNRFDSTYLPEIEDKLYFHGDNGLRKATNYAVLLLLATVIATYGVTSASTATVIGAMLVAPLMVPIMGTTLALVLGDGRRALQSLVTVLVSVTAVVLLAMLLSWFLPFVDFENNGEITSRIEPGLSALVVALAAGAVGAFATSRREVGDSMPGVAIAISLVPPLSVVGIAVAHGRGDDAMGALLLFVTNFLAILMAGGFVFWLVGASVLTLSPEQAAARKRAFLITGISGLVVTVMLATTSYGVYIGQKRYLASQTAVDTWLMGSDYEPVSITVRYPEVAVTVAGFGVLNSAADLAKELEAQGFADPRVVLKTLPREQEVYPEQAVPQPQ